MDIYKAGNIHRVVIQTKDDDQLNNEISLGEYKQCRTCKEFAHITLFEKPDLTRCMQCVNARLGVKTRCKISKCAVQVGSWYGHLKSKKNLRNKELLPCC